MAQNGKLIPNLDRQSSKLLNLIVLQRIDPFVEEILITVASHGMILWLVFSSVCYAYAATTAVEYIHQIRKKEFVEVSVKEILEAGVGVGVGVGVGSGDDGEGGKPFLVLDWIADNGILREPMDDENQVGNIVTIDNVPCFVLKSDLQLQKIILECCPVVVQFFVTDYFSENKGEIYYTTEKSPLDHDLVFTGWGTSADGIHYWNAQNSWGLEFGDAGFARIMWMGSLWWGPEHSPVRACVPVIY